MTSKDTGASDHALIDLIYRHLKENGFKKAASALKKHAPQVDTTNVKVSLDDIFKKWISEDQKKKGDEGKDLLTSSASKPQTAANATHTSNPEKKVKSQTPATARNQKRKRAEKKASKSPSVVASQATEHSPKTGEDSDSDSSLDVEKWKRLAMQLSDADIAKIDAFTNTSTAKSTKKRKPAQPKKRKDQTIGNGKSSPKKTKVKTTTSPTKTTKLEEVSNSNKPVLAGVSNGLDKVKVKRKKTHSISESDNTETPSKKAEIEKTADISEPKPSDTPCKKKKSKKDGKVAESGSLETPSKVTDPEVANSAEISESNDSKQSETVLQYKTGETKAKKHKSKKVKIVAPVGDDTYIQTETEDVTASLTSDQSKINQALDLNPETPSKKVKSKKSKKSKEPQDPEDTVTSGERQIEGKTSLLGTEKPSSEIESQAVTKILELGSDTPSKASKTSKSKKASESDQFDSPSKKAVVDVGQDEIMFSSKKSKRKRTDSSGENTTSLVTEHASKSSSEFDNSGVANSLQPTVNSTENEGQESVSALEEEGSSEPKKRKKSKKDKEKKKNESEENVEEVVSAPQAEEVLDLLSSSHKKKKKKKQKHGEEEMPSLSPPIEDTPKKKKKSSKEKENANESVQV